MDVESRIKKYALINATEHDGKAAAGSVLGRVLAESPELREKANELRQQVASIIAEVNTLSPNEQKKQLDELGGYQRAEKKEETGLPKLEHTGRVVVRFAPNPDGALHLGNARPAVLSHEYAKEYKGKFILRFDDTDPKVKRPETKFYKWVEQDLKWLGIRWNSKVIASKRLNVYYDFARQVIERSGAYVCTCDSDEWKQMRDAGVACPCRELDKKEHLKRWKKMLRADGRTKCVSGRGYREGRAVLRVKTFLGAENPAVRDWPAFRIVDKPRHPLVKKAKLWPLFNFASAIDDHALGVTHILRGQEHSTNEEKQKFLYRHFGWTYPKVIILGRFSAAGMVLSKSLIRRGIEEKKFTGWDDPSLGTLQALRRRGFQPKALRQLILDIGPKPNDVTIAFENLAAYNKKVVDKIADRYFFVPHPVAITLPEIPERIVTLKKHPDQKRGVRKIRVSKRLFVNAEDLQNLRGTEVRLIGLCNIILDDPIKITGKENKNIHKIQWVPDKGYVKVDVLTPDGLVSGYGESTLKKAKTGSVVQFERFGFCRIEKKSAGKITVVFGHR